MASTERLGDGRLVYDISPLVSEKTAVFPGDQPYSRQMSMSHEAGDNLLLSSITTSLHVGAHTDAPNHYHREGKGIAERSLTYYLGPCQVIAASPRTGLRLVWDDLGEDNMIDCERVLFKTNSFRDPNSWHNDFAALSPELIERLAGLGVKLVGIDTPSIDPATSKELESHAMVYRHNLAILEGIVLTDVPTGHYELVALPLKLSGADASPVRAILIASSLKASFSLP